MTFSLFASSSTDGTYPDRFPPPELKMGSCRDPELCPDPSVFFSEETGRGLHASKKTRQARLICAGCPVQVLCLTYGLQSAEPFGVWGGLDRFDRAAILGVRATRLARADPAPMRAFTVLCDRRACGKKIPLSQVGASLARDGERLCASCLPPARAKAC